MKSRTTKDIIKRLSQQFHLPEEEILKIISISQDYAWMTIESANREEADFKTCPIFGLGKFRVKKGRAQWLKEYNDEQRNKQFVERSGSTEEGILLNGDNQG